LRVTFGLFGKHR